MSSLPFSLRILWYDQANIAAGAQTERRGDAWPVRGLLGGKDLAGRSYLISIGQQPVPVATTAPSSD
jgi:hypothetical protein